MSRVKHAPTPWVIWQRGTDNDPTCVIACAPLDRLIIQTVGENDKANAEHICRCVNNFYTLLRACKEAKEASLDLSGGVACRFGEILEGAIAEAEKG